MPPKTALTACAESDGAPSGQACGPCLPVLSRPYLVPALLAAAAAFFYILFASPAIGWRDGPEFTVTSVFLDVGHPSGFPTYNLLAKIFTWIPLGSIGFRVTVFTALAGAAALFLFGSLLNLLHASPARAPAPLFLLASLPLFALDQAVFASSTELEVYSLNTAFLLLLLYCSARWHSGHGISWLYSGGFLYGVACGNHAALSLYLPVLLLLTYWGEPEPEKVGGPHRHLIRTGLLALFFLAGLSVYLLLLVRSMTDRLPVDFGRTDTLARFWSHVSDAKDSETHFKGLIKFEDLTYLAPIQFRNLCSPLFFLSLPFFAWGLRYLWKTFQILAVALPVLILVNVFFFYYWIDGSSAFLPAITAWFLAVSLGLGEAGRLAQARQILRPAAAALCAAAVTLSAVLMARDRVAESDAESGFQSTELYFPDLAAMPPESIAVHDNGWFPMLALQYAYSARPDVTLVLLTGLLNPELMAVPEPGKMPLAYFPVREDGTYLSPREPAFFNRFFTGNLSSGKRVFFQYGSLVGMVMPYLEPGARYMFLGEMKMDHLAGLRALEDGLYDDFVARNEAYWGRLAGGADGPPARKAPTYMYYVIFTVAQYLFDNGRYRETADTLGRFLETFARPDGRTFLPYDVLLNCYALRADSLRMAGDHRQALDIILELARIRPYYASNFLMLGYVHEALGNGPESLAALKRGVELDPLDYRIVLRYGLALAKYSSLAEATGFLAQGSATLEENRQHEAAAVVTRLRDCLLLPPWDPGPDIAPPAEPGAAYSPAPGLPAAPAEAGPESPSSGKSPSGSGTLAR
ncbi:MAG: DUF2723 domain-containing protein [Deltaproteobacteria bacterium]|nr:DUF2723 domain-containing protein [Deltaproteobacteria bacterium]